MFITIFFAEIMSFMK